MKNVAIIGAGTMGHGIAQVAAMAGFMTTLMDADRSAVEAALARVAKNLEGGVTRGKVTSEAAAAALDRLRPAKTMVDATQSADLVIEAIVEDASIKHDLFRTLDELTPSHCVLATNTSSLSIKGIAAATQRPERVVGMHFFNPVHIMKLVEVVRHEACADTTVEAVCDVAVQMGKQPITVKDVPGFASSRLGVVLGLEAMRMVEQGVASAADIDKALELGYGHPMGPLKVTDLVGLDVRLAIAEYLHETLGSPHYSPPDLLKRMVADGHLGKKSGKGFYEWPNPAS